MDSIVLPYGGSVIEVPLPIGPAPETAGRAFPDPLSDTSLSVKQALEDLEAIYVQLSGGDVDSRDEWHKFEGLLCRPEK